MWSRSPAGRRIRHLQIRSLILTVWLAATAAQLPAAGQAVNPRSMIRSRADGQAGPRASLADVAWLQGHWVGEMPQGPVEHYTLSPMFGQLPAFVRAADKKGVMFYEISLIAEVGGSLTVRVKHFTDALAGWEAQQGYIDRPLVARDATNLYFDGVTYSRTGPDSYGLFPQPLRH